MKITWFGHSTFRLDFSGKVVLIDPFFTGNPGFSGDPVVMVPIGDRFTMGPETAALAVKRFLPVRAAIPCHYGSFPMIEPTADRFVATMDGHPTQVIVPPKTVGVRI